MLSPPAWIHPSPDRDRSPVPHLRGLRSPEPPRLCGGRLVPARALGAVVREGAARAVLITWALALLCGGSYLLAPHLLTLPIPTAADPRLGALVLPGAPAEVPAAHRGLQAVHILYSACKCSQQVLEHLLARGARPELWSERILLVGLREVPDGGAALRARAAARGFRVDEVTAGELRSRYHIEAAPLLLVAEGGGRIHYLGGYSDRKRGPVIRDLEIAAALTRGASPRALPVFGCAVSASLQATLDPLHVISNAKED